MSQQSEIDGGELLRGPKRRRLEFNLDTSPREIDNGASSPRLRSPTHQDYTVGWITALPLEMAAARAMLDEIHDSLACRPDDTNAYVLGRIRGHNIVIACLPSGVYGTTSAAVVASQMRFSFPSIRIPLMVGIGGGAPSNKSDIRLGDVVVAIPTHGPAVIQFDFGKVVHEGQFQRTGVLNNPLPLLLTHVSKLRSQHEAEGCQIPQILSRTLAANPQMSTDYGHQGQNNDVLFNPDYEHVSPNNSCDHVCDYRNLIDRSSRDSDRPEVHYGSVASANQVMKHARTRDRLGKELGIICFEMEAAGLMDISSPLVVRGICDYSDSHKNKRWQRYAALTAAAYTKDLLSTMPADDPVRPVQRKVDAKDIAEHRKLMMDNLNFEVAEVRQATIKDAYHNTCKWLLAQTQYQDWLNVHKMGETGGFLWIKGKPGTGKSTIMKYALAQAKRTKSEHVIISFFFNARGEDLEKSTLGMYRSLLFQLLEKVPSLQRILDSLNPRLFARQTSLPFLMETFRKAVTSLEQERLLCFIDALDECPEDEVRDMIEFFEDMSQINITDRTYLHVCFSSRHYPHISIGIGLQLILEDQKGHASDINTYVSSKLIRAQKNKQIQEIRAEVVSRASGIFLWVVIVVRILNKEFEKGKIHRLRARLQDIPTELNHLFKDLLMRDRQDVPELVLCIQWILYAKRPLSREEFYYAMLSAQDSEPLGAWDVEKVTPQDMERLLLNTSKGLAEMTRSKPPKVQFIHESVREFLLKKDALVDIWHGFTGISVGLSHDTLKSCCYRYMSIDISNHIVLPQALPIASTAEAKKLRDTVGSRFPFLTYAVDYILFHADAAEGEGIEQHAFVESFPLQTWIQLFNLVQIYQKRRYSEKGSWVHLLSGESLSNLLKFQLTRDSQLPGTDEYWSCLLIAFANCSKDTIKALLLYNYRSSTNNDLPDISAELDQDLNTFFQYSRTPRLKTRGGLFDLVTQCGAITLVKLLLYQGIEIDKSYRGLRSLVTAITKKHGTIVKILLENVTDVELKYKLMEENLHVAANIGNKATVELLLGSGDCVASESSKRRALRIAAERGHEPVVKLLLDSNADVDSKDDRERSSLSLAAGQGHERVMKLLLDRGANANSKDFDGKSPLHYAARWGRDAVVKLLLDEGADINSKDKYGKLPLHFAAWYGQETAIKLLLNKGVDINSKDIDGKSPLEWAVDYQEEAAVKLLLEKGAEVNSKDEKGETPLHVASKRGLIGVIKGLLEGGANVNSKDNDGRTPLWAASQRGNIETIKVLLEGGATVAAKDNNGATPLYVASKWGHTGVVKILLGEGADLDSTDNEGRTPLWVASVNEGRTPLWAASEYGNTETIKILLEGGAIVDAKDNNGTTPLYSAAKYRYSGRIVSTLLQWGADIDAGKIEGLTLQEWAANQANTYDGKELVRIIDEHVKSTLQRAQRARIRQIWAS